MGKFKHFFGSTSFKRGSFTTLFTILFLVVVILLNVLCSALSARFPLNLDLTAGKDFSMNEENRPYISEIDTDIDILLLSTEDYYVNTYYLALEQQGTIEQQEENQRYFQQTVEILKTYQKINPRIHLTFIDPSTPAASDFVNKYYGEMTPTLGDLVVANREKVDNGEANGIRVLAFSGLYSLTDETGYASQGYGAYTIAGSNVEEKVISAIDFVTSDVVNTATFITGYGCSGYDLFSSLLSENNYAVETISTLLQDNIPEDTEILVLCAPINDLSTDELRKLDAYMKNDGALGKQLYYAASIDQPSLPNLESFLKEWGIEYGEGVVYETDPDYQASGVPYIMTGSLASSDYTANFDMSNRQLVGQYNRPLRLGFESYDKFRTQTIVEFSNTTVTQPMDEAQSNADWEPPANAQMGVHEGMVLSAYGEYINDGQELVTSNILAMSSPYFLADYNTAGIANLDLCLSLSNTLVGRDEDTVVVNTKVIALGTFNQAPTTAQYVTIGWIFIAAVPVIILVIGITIWVRRRHS